MCTGSSGQTNLITIDCRERGRCLLITSQLNDKLEAYQSAIERNNRWVLHHGKKLEVAEFLYRVTEDSRMRYATRTVLDGGSVDLFGECFRQNPDKAGQPRDATTTVLWKDLDDLRRDKSHSHRRVDQKSQDFVDTFKDDDLQNHLANEHESELPDLLSRYLLTMHFSESGLSYLKLFWDRTSNPETMAISKFAENTAGKSGSDALNEKEQIVLSCLLTYLIEKLRKYVQENRRTSREVLNYIQPDLDYFMDRFGEHGNRIVDGILSDSRHYQRIIGNVSPGYSRFDIENTVDQVNSVTSAIAGEYELESIGHVTSAISFLLAASKITESMGSDLKDNIAFTKECLSITSEIANTAETLSLASAAGKGLGLLGAMLGVATGIMNAVEQGQAGNVFLANVEAISTMAVFVGAFSGLISAGVSAGLAEATAFTAACGPIGIVCGIIVLAAGAIVWLFSDDPFVSYLKKTHWGIDPRYSWQNTIKEFYKLIPFEVRVPSQALGQQLWINSPALDDTTPLYIKLNRNNQMVGEWQIIYPYRHHHLSSSNNVQQWRWSEAEERRLTLLDLNAIWSGYSERGGDYVFYVAMDPDLSVTTINYNHFNLKGTASYRFG